MASVSSGLDSARLEVGAPAAMASTTPAPPATGTVEEIVARVNATVASLDKQRPLIDKLLSKSKKHRQQVREEEQRAARQAAEQADEEMDDAEDHNMGVAEGLYQQLEQQRQEGIVNHEEHREQEEVLARVVVNAEPETDLDAGYLGAAEAALAELGLEPFFASLAADDPQVHAVMFRAGVRSGYMQSAGLLAGAAHGPTLSALFATLARSPDGAAAGAAFTSLLCLLGEGEALQSLAMDPAYGLPPAASPVYASQRRDVSLGPLPTAEQLLEALRFNGYRSPDEVAAAAAAAAANGAPPGTRGSVGGADSQEAEGQQEAVKRIQAVKLVLQAGVAICRHLSKDTSRGGAAAAATSLPAQGLADLLLATIHLHLDSDAQLLRPDLEAAGAAALGAFTPAGWAAALPRLAQRVAGLGSTGLARLKVLKRLPASLPRGFALQQHAAALVLEALIPAGSGGAGGGRAASRGGKAGACGVGASSLDAFDPAAIISAQSWFAAPKELVEGASAAAACADGSGGARASNTSSSYTMNDIQLLLKLCDLLIWPHATAAGEAGEGGHPLGSPLRPDFLSKFIAFLSGVSRSIKSKHDMDHFATKTLASTLETDYTTARGEAVYGLT